MDINYELYKVFYHVASTLSFSEASKQLFISQSAVSQSIKVLEKKLNQTLFIRSTKRVQLTPEGEILLKHIEPAMNLIKKGENQLLEANTLNGGQLRIGASDTICRYFLVLPQLQIYNWDFPVLPQPLPQHPHQGDKPHLHRVRKALRKRAGGFYHHQLPQLGPFQYTEHQDAAPLSRRICSQ